MTTQEQILHTLGRIDGGVTSLRGEFAKHADQDQKNLEKIEARLNLIERAKWKLAGAMAASVFAAELLWRANV